MLAYGEWLEDHLLAPVPHRQYVFSLTKLARPFFCCRRRYLGQLCRLVAALLPGGIRTNSGIDRRKPGHQGAGS